MNSLSPEQRAVIEAPLAPLSVVACAGSGKTHTAVYRLVEVRRKMGEHRGYAALLAFSNISVKAFNESFAQLANGMSSSGAAHRIRIETLDSFLTTNILRPHACRTMACKKTPYLITGRETFLKNKDFFFWAVPSSGVAFQVPADDIENVVVNLVGGAPTFHYRFKRSLLPLNNGPLVAKRLAAVGAYTHGLGQYWAYQTLVTQPAILRALARRYPHIIIDEAQDVVSVHQALLDLLATAGVQISLVGDPQQAIYEFAGADGCFLKSYAGRPGVLSHVLTKNYRSVPPILAAANALSRRTDTAHRDAPANHHGAFFGGYREAELAPLIQIFLRAVVGAGLRPSNSTVVCRGRSLTNQLAGIGASVGQGTVKKFALAAVQRDRRGDYHAAFNTVAACVVALLADPPNSLLAEITQPARSPDMRSLIREIWTFTRDSDTGLPISTLTADTDWHVALLSRVKALLSRLKSRFGLSPTDNLGQKLSKKALPNSPFMTEAELTNAQDEIIPISTVHHVKGESLDAVLYIAETAHAQALIAGVDTEIGRIGYVAVTRAKDLFWLAIPDHSLPLLRGPLSALGFQELSPHPAQQD